LALSNIKQPSPFPYPKPPKLFKENFSRKE
jgi:hypothetical protein